MVFAGAVFPEWYWGPIFFYIVFGLPLSAAAFAVDFAVRRWVRRLGWPQRAALWVGVVAGGSLAILGGRALIDHVRFERDAKAAAQKLDFAPYRPEKLPAGFDEEMVRADDFFGGPVLVSRYAVGAAPYAFAYQQRPHEVSLQDGRCSLRGLAGTGTNFYDGPCRELRTPHGRAVFIGALGITTEGGQAFSLLDGTLVRLEHSQVADRDVLAYFDSLRPVAPDDLDFKQG
jgi:hypothetical protein